MLQVLLYTIRCSLPKAPAGRIHYSLFCSLFTKKLFASLLAIRSLLFTIHCFTVPPSLPPTKAPAGKIHCLLFTVHQKLFANWLFIFCLFANWLFAIYCSLKPGTHHQSLSSPPVPCYCSSQKRLVSLFLRLNRDHRKTLGRIISVSLNQNELDICT